MSCEGMKNNMGKRVVRMVAERRRRKQRPKRRWIDSVNVDLSGKGLSGEQTQLCGGNLSHISITPKSEKWERCGGRRSRHMKYGVFAKTLLAKERDGDGDAVE